MKKTIIYLTLFFSILFTSCLKDETNLDLKEVSIILIDTTGIDQFFNLYQLDSLKISPGVTIGGSSDLSTLKYKWTMNAYGGYERVVGTSKNLECKITEAPTSASYKLIFTFTDTITNLKNFFSWDVTVSSVFSHGLIVADTKDNVTSDLNLIMAFNFNYSIRDDEPRVYREVYSLSNGGSKINGVVKGLSYMSYYGQSKYITVLTDNSVLKIDPISYRLELIDNELFLLPPNSIKPSMVQSVQVVNHREYIVNDGRVHHRYSSTVQYGYPYMLDVNGYRCEKMCALQRPSSTGGIIYDEKYNRFLMLPSLTSSSDPLVSFPQIDNSNPAPAFDPRDIGNKTCLNLEEGQNKRIVAVMKDRDLEQYFVYQISDVARKSGKMGYSVHNISSNPDIQNSQFYTNSTSENVLFYATDTKIYSSTLMVDGTSRSNLRYTTASGEKITGMKIHIMNGFMYLPSSTAPEDYDSKRMFQSVNRLVIISTYNETTKEGKIVTIPIEVLGVGGLVSDPAYIRTFSGFGKITSFNFQAT